MCLFLHRYLQECINSATLFAQRLMVTVPTQDAMKESPWGEGSHRPPWSQGWPGAGQMVAGYVAHGHVTAMARGNKTFPDHRPGLCFLVSMAMQGQPQSQPWLHRGHVHPAASVLPVPAHAFPSSGRFLVQHLGAWFFFFPFYEIVGCVTAFAAPSSCVRQPHNNRCLGSEWSALSRTGSHHFW